MVDVNNEQMPINRFKQCECVYVIEIRELNKNSLNALYQCSTFLFNFTLSFWSYAPGKKVGIDGKKDSRTDGRLLYA